MRLEKNILCFICFISIIFTSCWSEQWEDRVANGDTGSVTHGNPAPDTASHVISSSNGRLYFKSWCASCHNTSSKTSTGPGLMDVLERIPNNEWGINFVQNEDSLIKSGDPYTIAMRKKSEIKWNHSFKQLTAEEIKQILSYADARPMRQY
jgi:cytochrome c2